MMPNILSSVVARVNVPAWVSVERGTVRSTIVVTQNVHHAQHDRSRLSEHETLWHIVSRLQWIPKTGIRFLTGRVKKLEWYQRLWKR